MDAIKDESPEFKRDIYGKIMDANRQILDKENEVRAEKGRQREGFQRARQMIGNLAAMKVQTGYGDDQYTYMPAVVLSATFASGKGQAVVLTLDAWSGRIGESHQSATAVTPLQDATQDQNFLTRVRAFADYIIRYPQTAQKVGEKAMQELRRLVPDLADQLQGQKDQQPQGDLFGNQPQTPEPPGPPRGWDRV